MQISGYFKGSGFYSAIIFILLAYMFLSFPSEFSKGTYEGLLLSGNVIIPALFPFTVLSVFLVKSGGLNAFGKLLNKPAGLIFGLSGSELSALVISLLGGYPLGGKIIKESVSGGLILKERGKKLLRFAVNPSPAFYITFIGSGLTANENFGILLFAANSAATLILTFVSFKFSKNKKRLYKTEKFQALPPTDAFVQSVYDGSAVIISICGFSILFSSLLRVVSGFARSNTLKAVISALFEITVGAKELANSGISVYLLAFFVSFGGFSVLCQVKQAAGFVINFKSLIVFRLIHGSTTAAATYIAFKIFKPTVDVISNNIEIIRPTFKITLSFIFLMLFAVIFIVYLRKSKNLPKKI